jgi:uncharacterized membrane protein
MALAAHFATMCVLSFNGYYSLRGLAIVLAFYLAYRLVRATERIATATEQLAER